MKIPALQERDHSTPFGPAAGQHHSLAFTQLLRELSGGRKKRVLDLGPAVGGNVSFFSQFSCKLYIADFFGNLHPRTPTIGDRAPFAETVDRLIPSTDGEPVDLILAWDLLNYLELDQISVLAERLAPLCRRQTMLFAMISTLKEISDRPLDYEIQDSSTLTYNADPRMRRPCPRYREPDLERSMHGFSVETSFLLRNGTQEYLFVYSPDGDEATDA